MQVPVRGFDSNCMFLNENYLILNSYELEFFSNGNLTIGVSKLSLGESTFDIDRSSSGSERHLLFVLKKGKFCSWRTS